MTNCKTRKYSLKTAIGKKNVINYTIDKNIFLDMDR